MQSQVSGPHWRVGSTSFLTPAQLGLGVTSPAGPKPAENFLLLQRDSFHDGCFSRGPPGDLPARGPKEGPDCLGTGCRLTDCPRWSPTGTRWSFHRLAQRLALPPMEGGSPWGSFAQDPALEPACVHSPRTGSLVGRADRPGPSLLCVWHGEATHSGHFWKAPGAAGDHHCLGRGL